MFWRIFLICSFGRVYGCSSVRSSENAFGCLGVLVSNFRLFDCSWWQSDAVLFESLRKLQLMALTVDTLKVRLNLSLVIELV